MQVIVTGGAGFIGSHTVEALLTARHRVLILDNFSTGNMRNIAHLLTDGVRYANCDALVNECDVAGLPGVLQVFADFKPEAVIHLAAQAAITTAWENPAKDMLTNGLGTLNILQACKRFGVRRFVLASTSAVYREGKHAFWKSTKETSPLEPKSPYGTSKMSAEIYARLFLPGAIILRYGNVYGPRQVPIGENQVVPRMIRHFKYGDKFCIHGSGNQKRDFVYVEDVAHANTEALRGEPGTYNIASGKAVSVNEIAALIENAYGVPGYPWEHTAAEDPRKQVCLEVSRARDGLGWRAATSLREGIHKTVSWWEKQP